MVYGFGTGLKAILEYGTGTVNSDKIFELKKRILFVKCAEVTYRSNFHIKLKVGYNEDDFSYFIAELNKIVENPDYATGTIWLECGSILVIEKRSFHEPADWVMHKFPIIPSYLT